MPKHACDHKLALTQTNIQSFQPFQSGNKSSINVSIISANQFNNTVYPTDKPSKKVEKSTGKHKNWLNVFFFFEQWCVDTKLKCYDELIFTFFLTF